MMSRPEAFRRFYNSIPILVGTFRSRRAVVTYTVFTALEDVTMKVDGGKHDIE